ncbi:RNA ligase family protein [Burkholderia vietnamiensis]|uniref:RNA ligase family protein n=1 Tax=Burkholderia vietnamiensis TaxID=60552 RepID=UPI002650778F|nr:RNA ligase family protein [Burkholderia vietnamiensis]MDN8037438.1 RNA ligase family protein [Burkholderia vietnamiensis]
MEFSPYPKTPRLKRDIVITEKIDGTNAQVVIKDVHVGDFPPNVIDYLSLDGGVCRVLLAGSRSRWITPGKETDNYGFAAWCRDNSEELFKLGEGQHFGEWYGQGIQRNYGLDHRRFALFNTARWGIHNPNTPACCEVVPVLATCSMDQIDTVLWGLQMNGSKAVPGFMNPEGVIAYHSASKQNFKVLLENDHLPKGEAA